MSVAIWVSLMVVLDGVAGLAGAAIPERWLERFRAPMLAFAAGSLLASGVAEVIPEAIARAGMAALVWAATAFALLAIVEAVSARRGRHRDRPVAPAALLGSDALHNVGDGMAIAAAFLVSIHLGIATALAVIVHEVPEEVADYALLRAGGVGKRRSLIALAAVQLTAAIGAAGTLMASRLVADEAGVILAIAGGTFAYIGAVDLLPDVVRGRSPRSVVAFAIGAAVVLGVPG